MTLVPLTTCSQTLGIDPKTLRLWLHAAQLSCCPHPTDARLKCLTTSQVQHLAHLHGRPLLSAEQANASHPASVGLLTDQPEASVQGDEAALQLQLASLQHQVVTLQAQVAELALALLAMQSPPTLTARTPLAMAPVLENQTVSSASSPSRQDSSPTRQQPRKRSRALPLIQVRPDRSVVVIAPQEGVLPLLPDSPEWFHWLASIEAFSFECPTGHYSVTRKLRNGQRIQTWNLHCSLHGRSCTLYVGQTPTLTLARLLEMVTIIRTRLAVS